MEGKGFRKPQYTQIPNDLLDKKMQGLGLGELKVLLVIFRQTVGYHKNSRRISRTKLAGMAGVSKSTLHDAIDSLIDMGMIEKITDRGVTQWSVVWDDDIIADPIVEDGSETEPVGRNSSRIGSDTELPSTKESIKDKYRSFEDLSQSKATHLVNDVPEIIKSIMTGFAQVWVEVYGFNLTEGVQKGWLNYALQLHQEFGEVPADVMVEAGEDHKFEKLDIANPTSLAYRVRTILTDRAEGGTKKRKYSDEF